MVAINPNNYPNSALAASAPPAAPATTPTPAATPDATQPSAEEAPATGEAVDTPEAAAAKPATGDSSTPATPDLVISKDMAEALSSDQIQKLIKGILADGTVDKLDDAQLKQLNILLTAAAKKDGKVSGEEDSLIDALDSRGMFGTNREVVKANLQALRKHEGEANTLNFGDGSIQVTTQDGVSGFFGGKQTRGLRMEMVDLDSSTPPANNVTPTGETTGPSEKPTTPNTPSPTTENTSSPDVASPTPVTPPVDPEKALSTETRQAYNGEALAQNTANEAQLKEDLNYLKNAFSKVPDEVIAQDIQSLVEHSDNEGYDMTYVKNQLQNWKITLPENLQDSKSAEDMKAFLSTYEVSPENIQAYRQSINTVIDKATSESPLTGTALSDAKKFLYDTNYIFENPANVPEEDYQRYSQFKTSLLNYQDSEARVKNIARNENISTTNVELDNQLLSNYNQKAATEIQDLAQNVNTFLKQVESKNAGDEEVQALRSQLGEVVEVDAQGQLVLNAEGKPQVKQPITQQHLENLNKIWASLEAVGMQNGLDRETGEITQDFFKELQSKTEAGNPKAIEQWNTIQKSPAGEILAAKPEIAQYADLLKVLDDPKNAALKAALFSSDNPEQAVNELLNKHNNAVLNDMFSDFGSIWNVGPASYLTSWGCTVVPGAADTAFCKGIAGPSTRLLDPSVPNSLPDYSLSLNNTTAKASFGLDLQTPTLSLNTPLPSTNGKLGLGSYTTEDVRQLLDLLKDPQALENPETATDEEKTAAAYALAEKQKLRAQLKEHSSDIAGFINDTPELEELRQQLDAKEAFDSAFWGDNSDMDQARQSVKNLVSKQDRVGSDLAVAEAQIKEALNQMPEGEARALLEEKLSTLQKAQQELKNTGQMYTTGGPQKEEIQSVFNSLLGKGVVSNPNANSQQNLIADTEAEFALSKVKHTMDTLKELSNNPQQKEALLQKFPVEQRSKIDNLLANHELLNTIQNQILADPSRIDPEALKAFSFASNLINIAQNGTTAEIQQALEMSFPGSTLSVSDGIEHMDNLLKEVNSLKTEDMNLKATYATALMEHFNKNAFTEGQSVKQAWEHFENGSATIDGKTIPVKQAVQEALVNNLKAKGQGLIVADFSSLKTDDYLKRTLNGDESANFKDQFSDFQNKAEALKKFQSQLKEAQDQWADPGTPRSQREELEKTIKSLRQNALDSLQELNRFTQDLVPVINAANKEDKKALLELQVAASNFTKESLQQIQQDRFASFSKSGKALNADDEFVKNLSENKNGVAGIIFSVENRLNQATGLEKAELELVLNMANFESEQLKRAQAVNADYKASQQGVTFSELFFEARENAEEAQSQGNEKIEKNRGVLGANYNRFRNLALSGDLSPSAIQETSRILAPLKETNSTAYIELMGVQYGVGSAFSDVQTFTHLSQNANDPQEQERLAHKYATSPIATGLMQYLSNEEGEGRIPPLSQTSDEGAQFIDEVFNSNPPLTLEQISQKGLAFAERNNIKDPTFLALFSPSEGSTQGGIFSRRDQLLAVGKELGEDPILASEAKSIAAQGTESLAQDTESNYGISAETVFENIEKVDYAQGTAKIAEDIIDFVGEQAIKAETGQISWDTFRKETQTPLADQIEVVAQRQDKLNQVMSKMTGIEVPPLSEKYRLEAGLPVHNTTKSSGGTAAEQKAAALVEEANALASRLSLAPEGPDSDKFLSELISGFIDTIRDQDYKTRQLIMAQLANQMMTDSITTFYKDKTDKNNKYHQDAIERMANAMQQMIQRTLQDSLLNAASDGQGIAALSGQVGAANTAEAMGLEQLRQSTEELLSETQKMEPPLITDLQKERLLQTLFDKNPDNDMLGILTLAGAVN